MTCPHCGATARDNERFCPRCSRLVDSPLLKMRRELDAMRAAMQRDRQAPLSKAASAPVTTPQGPAAVSPSQPSTAKQARNEKRKAEIRARLAAQRQAVPPPPTPREAHTRAAHDSVPDSTLERALRSEASDAAEALERARQANAPPAPAPPQPRPSKGKKAGTPRPSPRPASGGGQSAATSEPGRRTSAVIVLVLVNLATLLALVLAVSALREMPDGSLGRNAAEAAQVGAYVYGGLVALATLGLLTVAPFGRALQRLVSVSWLPVFPFGTLFAFVSLLYLGGRGARLLFSGRGASQLDASEHEVLGRHRKFAPLMALVFLALGGMAWGNAVGAGAGLQPLLLQRGTITEAVNAQLGGPATADAPDPLEAVLGDLENYAIKQAAYAHANAGYFDRTECLVSNDCVPDRDLLAAPLEARYLEPVRHGFEFRARLGPPPQERGAGVSATSVVSFTYVAIPVEPSAGAYGYCVERGLTVCRFDARQPITSPPDECPAGCEFVR